MPPDGFNWDTLGTPEAPAAPAAAVDWDSLGTPDQQAPVAAAPTPPPPGATPVTAQAEPLPDFDPSVYASDYTAPSIVPGSTDGPSNRVNSAALNGAIQGWGGGPTDFSPEYQAANKRLDELGGVTGAIGKGINLAANTVGHGLAAVGGYLGAGIAQAGAELPAWTHGEQLGRDLAGYALEGGAMAGPFRRPGARDVPPAEDMTLRPPGEPPRALPGPPEPTPGGPTPSTGPTEPAPAAPAPAAPTPEPAPTAPAPAPTTPRVNYFSESTGDYRSGEVMGTAPDGRIWIRTAPGVPWVKVPSEAILPATPGAPSAEPGYTAPPVASVESTPPASPESPPARITTAEVQRRDGVGYNEAKRRADAENAAASGAPPAPPESPAPPAANPPAPEPATPPAPQSTGEPPAVFPVGSTVSVLDLDGGAWVPGMVTGHLDGGLLVDAGTGVPMHVDPAGVVPIEVAPMPPEPRSVQTIMQEEGVGAPQAIRKARAERDHYQAMTGIVLPTNTRDELEGMLTDPRSNAEIATELAQGTEPPPGGAPTAEPPPVTTGTGTAGSPIRVTQPGDLAAAAGNVATPTPGQAEAGNYPKGHVVIGGLPGAIETPMGGTRTGTAPDGTTWSSILPADYGYIKGTTGADGDHVDAYFGPNSHVINSRSEAFIVDQIDPATGTFDEHKLMIGFPSQEAAQHVYEAAFGDGSGASRLGAITPIVWPALKLWLGDKAATKRAFRYLSPEDADKARHATNLEHVANVTKRAGIKFSPAEHNEAAIEIAGGLSPEDAVLKVAARVAVEAVAKAEGDPGNVEQQGGQLQPGAKGAGAGVGGGTVDGGGAKPPTSGEQSPGGLGPVPASGAGDTADQREPGAQAGGPSGGSGSGSGSGGGQSGGAGGANTQIHPANETGTPGDAEPQATGPGEANLKPAESLDSLKLANFFRDEFARGAVYPSITDARRAASLEIGARIMPGTIVAKQLDEAIELGVVLRARDITAGGGDPGAAFDALLHLYAVQMPRLGVRTSDSMERQAYSTPVPLAYTASVLGNIGPGSWVYEPSAGNGALLIGVPDPNLAFANEIDPARAGALRAQGFQPSISNAAQPLGNVPPPRAVDTVIANPPFGPVKDEAGNTIRYDMGFIQPGYSTGEIDHAISLHALEAMADNGYAVLILGGLNKLIKTPEGRADAYNKSKPKREFFHTLYTKYNVVDHFTVSGELYAKQGAAWPVDVVVIKGRGKTVLPLPAVAAPRVIETWAGVKEVLYAAPPTEARVADRGSQTGVGTPGVPGRDQHPAATDPAGQADISGGVLPGVEPASGVDDRPGGRPGGSHAGAGGGSGGPGGMVRPGEVHQRPSSGAADDTEQPGVPGGVPNTELAHPTGGSGAGNASGGAGDRGRDDVGLAGAGPGGTGGSVGKKPRKPRAKKPRFATEEEAQADFERRQRERDEARRRAEAEERAYWQQFNQQQQGGRRPEEPGARTTPADGTPRGLDAEGRWYLVHGEFVENQNRTPIMFPRQIDAARWIIRTGQADSFDQVFEIANHPTVSGGFTVRETYRNAGDNTAPPPPAPEPEPPEDQGPIDRATIEIEAAQTEYVPLSKATPVGTLVPTNLSSAIANALDRIIERVQKETPGATVDSFVAGRLKYTPREIEEYFSAEQVDAIALAIAQVDAGQGFVIGDQTGVGKGRVVAAMIRYASLKGLVPIFVTERPNLYADMVRDLSDIGMSDFADKILATDNALRLQLTDDPRGPRLRTPAKEVHELELRRVATEVHRTGRLPSEYSVMMTTYTQMQTQRGARTTRQNLLTNLAPRAFLIMDEAHNAGGAAGNKEEMTDKRGRLILPRSVFFRQVVAAANSVFYSSATWAKRPDVMDLYGAKTSMRFAVSDLAGLADAIARGGVPMQQIVTAGLAEGGQYIRRERSFDGVTYEIVPIEVDKEAYDRIASVLKAIYDVSAMVKGAVSDISDAIRETASSAGGNQATGEAGADSTSFGAVMHNLINQMLLASKTKAGLDRILEKLAEDKKPVITLANTMGSFIKEFAAEKGVSPGDALDLTFNNLLERYLRKTLDYTEKQPYQEAKEKVTLRPEQLSDGGALYYQTEAAIRGLDLGSMPVSPIDYLHAELKKRGYRVGEITGRGEAADYGLDGVIRYRIRPGNERTANAKAAAIRSFNAGDLDVMILNQSGATGVSLHASSKFKDQRKRAMLILQAEANIDTHMQMLGRVHRTGQVITPEYEQLVADIPAEKRPAAVLAAKMASLNAATTSARKSVLGDENAPDFLNSYGDEVVAEVLENMPGLNAALMNPSKDDEESDAGLARRVTGRIPLLPLEQQTTVYDMIETRYRQMIADLDAAGENALEAKRLPLDARQIEQRELVPPNTDGSGPFAEAAFLTKYNVKRMQRPPTPQKIVATMLRGNERDDLAAEADNATVERLAELIDVMAKDTGQLDTILRAIEVTHAREMAREFRKEGAAEAHQTKVTATRTRLEALLRLIQPGKVIWIGKGAGDPDRQTAIVERVTINDDLGDLAPSKYTLHVVTTDGLYRTLGGAGLFSTGTEDEAAVLRGARVVGTSPMQLAAVLSNIETEGQQTREERWIVTGNLLAAFDAVGRGQIANFTDEKGLLHQGIIMARGYNPEADTTNGVHMRRGLAEGFLGQTYGDTPPFVLTSDGRVRVAADTRGNFILSVPASRERGAVYFLNNDLRRVAGTFVARGNTMRVGFMRASLPRVMEALAEINQAQQVDWVSTHPNARAYAEENRGWNSDQDGGRGRSRPMRGPDQVETEPQLPIQPAALNVLAGTIFEMTGNRVEIDVLRRPLNANSQFVPQSPTGYSIGGSLIQVALQTPERMAHVLHHETIHALRTFNLIRGGEWKALEARSAAEDWQGRYHITVRYGDFPEDLRQEEAIAEGFADYMSKRKPAPKGLIAPAVSRVRTFFARTASALQGKGFTRAEDVFERIATGKVGKRDQSPNQEDRPAITPDQAREVVGLGLVAGLNPADTLKTLTAAGIVDPSLNNDVSDMMLKVAASVRFALGPTPGPGPGPTVPVAGGAASTWLTHFTDVGKMVRETAAAVNMALDPMTTGSDDSMLIAKRAANAVRAIRYAGNKELVRLGRDYTPEQLKRMWETLDTESVERQMGQPTTGFGAMAAFPKLTAEERDEADIGQKASVLVWKQARKLGMVHGDPLPSYVPRMVINVDDPSKETHVVKDYRTLILATMRLQEAIAWRIMIEQIKTVGIRTGVKTVHTGSLDSAGHPLDPLSGTPTTTPQMMRRKHLTVEETEDAARRLPVQKDKPWFTIPQSAAFWTIRWSHNDANGEPQFKRVPIHIRADFEGPLRAVLHKTAGPTNRLVRGLLDLKGRMMTAIMWGVKHLGVVAFRAATFRPNLIAAAREGKQARDDAVTMRRLILAGLVPMGRTGSFQDATGIEREIEDKPGRGWTAQVLAWPVSFINARAAELVKRGVDKGGAVHTFMWDMVQSLQVGVALGAERSLIKKGMDPKDAAIVAARAGNLIAGAIPHEAMSQGFATVLNLAWFSRSYRATSFAAPKDMFGLPRDLQALVLANHPGATKVPASVTRAFRQNGAIRAAQQLAWRIIALEMGLFYLAGSLLQSGLTIANGEKTFPQELHGYVDRMLEVGGDVAHGRRFNPFRAMNDLTPMSENEPGKEMRIKIGHDDQGTAVYIRLGFGKIAEDMIGYVTQPWKVSHDIVSPYFRWANGIWNNDAGMDRKVYDPHAKTNLEYLANASDIAQWTVSLMLPTTELGSAHKLAKGSGGAFQAGQIALGGLGFSLSHGYPGGEVKGAVHEVGEEHKFRVARAIRAAIDAYRDGDIDKAREKMSEVGLKPHEQVRVLARIDKPGATPRQILKMLPFADDKQRGVMLGR